VSGNTASSAPDVSGSYTDNGGNVVGSSTINLASLANYGGPTQTMIPLPGSSAICAGTQTNVTAAGLTADQRGLGFDPNCPSGSVDSGAVQTQYAMNFTTSPNDTIAGQTLAPSPVVALTEDGTAFIAGAVSVNVSAAAGTLSGTTSVSTSTTSGPAAGTATFSGLSISSAQSADTLKATVALTNSLNLTASSASFNVTQETVSATCSSTNTGTINDAFNSGPESVSGGIGSYTFYVGTGSLPAGLNLNSSNGTVFGTPSSTGTFILNVKDANNVVSTTGCSFTIAPAATLAITWSTPVPITYPTPLSATQLNAGSNVAGAFTYNPPAGTVLQPGSQTLSATFTPVDTGNYKVTTVHVTIQVNKATPVISWTPKPLQIDSKLGAAQLDATASVPGRFVYIPAEGTEIKTTTETLKAVFTPTNTTDYNSVDTSVPLPVSVIKVSPTSINFGTVKLDSITARNVTVTNLGPYPVAIYNPLLSIVKNGNSKEFLAENLCPKSLAAHDSCTIKVEFVGGPIYHEQSATLSVMTSSPGSPQDVSLTASTKEP
jgi:hypothetical protein